MNPKRAEERGWFQQQTASFLNYSNSLKSSKYYMEGKSGGRKKILPQNQPTLPFVVHTAFTQQARPALHELLQHTATFLCAVPCTHIWSLTQAFISNGEQQSMAQRAKTAWSRIREGLELGLVLERASVKKQLPNPVSHSSVCRSWKPQSSSKRMLCNVFRNTMSCGSCQVSSVRLNL